MKFKTPYQEFIFYRTYSRYNDQFGRRETWEETVDRYISFMKENVGNKYSEKDYSDIREAIINLEVMPSMRLLWSSGDPARKTNVTGYNCSFIAPTKLRDFGEIMYLSMCGTGVGYSVEKKNIDKLPEIKEQNGEVEETYIIKDSREGWAEALIYGLKTWYSGRDVEFDYSKIRPNGARLKTMGGRASGPEPLRSLLTFTREKILDNQNRKLSTLDVHDIICKIGEIVVSGGVRRTALISLSDLHDEQIRNSKNGAFWETNPQRSMANNSAVYEKKPTQEEFLREWLSLINSKTGERGIFNRGSIEKQMPTRREQGTNWNIMETLGTNPCVTGDTPILTDKGYINIEETIGKKTTIWNGIKWSPVVPFSTGLNELVDVRLSDGTNLKCTKYHKWIVNNGERVEAQNLKEGDRLDKFSMPIIEAGEEYLTDAYSQGFYSGDGNKGYTYSYIYEPKYPVIKRLTGSINEETKYNRRRWIHGAMLEKNFVPVNGSSSYVYNWLSGLIDSDGTLLKDGSVQISSIDKEFLLKVRLMLTRVGVQAKVSLGKLATEKMMPDGKGGMKEYSCKESWRLLINASDTQLLFESGVHCERIDLSVVSPNRDARRFVFVVDVVDLGYSEETFCFTEEDNNSGTFNGIVTAQCGEITLRSKQFCNLSEVVARPNDTINTLKEKIRIATMIGTYQSSLTDFPFLSKEWKENCEEERLLGVSITGQHDCRIVKNKNTLSMLRDYAIQVNKKYAQKLGINQSASITCVKPSGTVSQLVDSSSGLHTRHAPFYIRRVRISANDPLFSMMKEQGMKYKPEVGQTIENAHTYVFEFPIASPANAQTKQTAIEQLEHWKLVKENYTEHNPSVTVSVDDNEWLDVAKWVWDNWDIVGGLSFLPKSNHVYQLAPYEEIDEKTYKQMVKEMPNIDFSKIEEYEKEDNTQGAKELACSAGVCEIA